jgi:hypothetical protein
VSGEIFPEAILTVLRLVSNPTVATFHVDFETVGLGLWDFGKLLPILDESVRRSVSVLPDQLPDEFPALV